MVGSSGTTVVFGEIHRAQNRRASKAAWGRFVTLVPTTVFSCEPIGSPGKLPRMGKTSLEEDFFQNSYAVVQGVIDVSDCEHIIRSLEVVSERHADVCPLMPTGVHAWRISSPVTRD